MASRKYVGNRVRIITMLAIHVIVFVGVFG